VITVKENNGKYDVTIHGITILGCKRMQGTSKKTGNDYDFISPPDQEFVNKDGEKKYKKIIMFDKDTADAIHAAVTGGRVDTGGGSGYGSQEPAFDDESDIPF